MNFVRSEKLNAMFAGAFVLTMSLGACAPAQDGELASEDTEDVDAESAQQALSATFTPSAFTMSGAYNGTSFFGGGCSAKQSLIGHEPSAAGKYPVAVWLTGTAADYAGEGALAFTRSVTSLCGRVNFMAFCRRLPSTAVRICASPEIAMSASTGRTVKVMPRISAASPAAAAT